MTEGHGWKIGICGTFDVANYGDLLFPLIAELELTDRLGAVALHRFSYHARTPPEWPYAVTSLTALPEMIDSLDGLLIGGGHLIRFDKDVARGYLPPAPEIHHPTGYWLTPALMALQHNIPVGWNAPGADVHAIAGWAHPLLATALTLSRYVSVRDELSRQALERFTSTPIAVVPDTAFGLPRLLSAEASPSENPGGVSPLDGPFIVIQASRGLEGFVRFVKTHARQLRDFRFLVLPIGPALGDDCDLIDAGLPGLVRLSKWPGPVAIARLISCAEAVIGQSYHFCITALATGVPAFIRKDTADARFSALQHFDKLFDLPDGRTDIDWFVARVGKGQPCSSVRATGALLSDHWDRIAGVICTKRSATASTMNRFWQSVPALLEPAARREMFVRQRVEARQTRETAATMEPPQPSITKPARGAAPQTAELEMRLAEAVRQLTAARAEIATRDAQITEIQASLSWKVTALLRRAGGVIGRRKPMVMNTALIRNHRLETYPYSWAAVNCLFDPDDASELAATYPCDHFKLVSSFDGEKEYEYEVRPLIGMGAGSVTYPEELSNVWRKLASDLLSSEYRAAMSALTGRDLSQAPLEVNVFHYGPGDSLGAHKDLADKIVTHVLYFNESWEGANGGCLRILRSQDVTDVVAEIPPLIGYSSVLVRSDNSWHAVSRVARNSTSSRRSVTVTFYRPGSISTMWPPGDTTPLHRYEQ